jgi:ATP adenylyltransferase
MPLFSDLLDFIQNRMRMSHIYQPVKLTTLLRNDGAASVRQIAQRYWSISAAAAAPP